MRRFIYLLVLIASLSAIFAPSVSAQDYLCGTDFPDRVYTLNWQQIHKEYPAGTLIGQVNSSYVYDPVSNTAVITSTLIRNDNGKWGERIPWQTTVKLPVCNDAEIMDTQVSEISDQADPWAPPSVETMLYKVTEPSLLGQTVTFYWVAGDGSEMPMPEMTSVVSSYGDISLTINPGEHTASPELGTYVTDSGETVQGWAIFIAKVNGQELQKVLLVPDVNGMSKVYVLYVNEALQAPRPFAVIHTAQ